MPPINITGIEQKDYINCLGVYIDKHLNWQPQIQHVNNKLAQHFGILSKLRYYIDLDILNQIYCALIYPYLSYVILAWGCASKTGIDCLRIKQNKCSAASSLHILEKVLLSISNS